MSKRILIADDSLTIQKAFAMTFAGEDVTLLAARSADEGLTMARQARPELVIADAVMPGRSGYDLCSAIKSDPNLRGVPVYILASAHNPYDESRGRQSGVDGSLTKPFDSTALIERVKEAIAKGPTASVSSLSAAARPPLTSVPAGPALGQPARSVDLDDDDYGEITIDAAVARDAGTGRPGVDTTPAPATPLVMPQRPTAIPPAAAAAAPAGLRPSLIPGLRPGAAPPPGRPGMTAPRPASGPGVSAPVAQSPASAYSPGSPGARPTMPPASTGPARTLIGLPATMTQAPSRLGVPTAPVRPPTQPVRPLDSRTPPPTGFGGMAPAAVPGMPAAISAQIENRVDQKIAAISARGPEYEAIAKLSREIIEKIVWEVVPELAEVIVREELQKRGRI